MSHRVTFESVRHDGTRDLEEMLYVDSPEKSAVLAVDELLRSREIALIIEPAESAAYLVNELQARVLRILADHGGEKHVTGLVEAFDAGCAHMTKEHRAAQYMALPLWMRDAMFLTDTYYDLRAQVMQRRAAA